MIFENIKQDLQNNPKRWLITGVAGFIGSNLLEALLKLDQIVVGLDNLSTGYLSNLTEVESAVSRDQWNRFVFKDGDITSMGICEAATTNIDYVLHQAALGSVPRSIADPSATNAVNITGFLNMLTAARDGNVKSFTYAASSSTYGDHPALPKVEENIGNPLSPYAVTKYVNELYADVYSKAYGFNSIGLRYFNVFGRRQDPNGAYAAVIPKWISSLLQNEDININGDGKTSRDFCYIENVVQANILAALAEDSAKNEVYNIAVGESTSLDELVDILKLELLDSGFVSSSKIKYRDFRTGDVLHSLASISKARSKLGYQPTYRIKSGIKEALDWYTDLSNWEI